MSIAEALMPTGKKIGLAAILFLVITFIAFFAGKTIDPSGSCMDATCHDIGFPSVFGFEVTGCGGPICPEGAGLSTDYEFMSILNFIIDLAVMYLIAALIIGNKKMVKK